MSKRTLGPALVCLVLFANSATSQDVAEVTYIANEGFLVEIGETRILLDALFGGLQGDWADEPDEVTASKLVKAQPPFDEIDIITISHKHADHFSDEMVVEHILNNRKVKVVCPRQVAEILEQSPHYSKIKENLVVITPKKMEDETIQIAGIGVRILRLEHSHFWEKDPETGEQRDRHSGIENLGFVLDVDGYKIFHCGDTNPSNEKEYERFALLEEPIDLAFLERTFLAGEGQPGVGLIETFLQPKQIVLMHISPARRQVFKNVAQALEDRLPRIYVFDKPMDQTSFKMK